VETSYIKKKGTVVLQAIQHPDINLEEMKTKNKSEFAVWELRRKPRIFEYEV
jgi:hypothetical protein